MRIAGHKEVAGRPFIYETTPAFLELFGLKSLDALPDLEEIRAIEGALANVLDATDRATETPDNDLAPGLIPAPSDRGVDAIAESPIGPADCDGIDETVTDSTAVPSVKS
jgi:hypothetical protein